MGLPFPEVQHAVPENRAVQQFAGTARQIWRFIPFVLLFTHIFLIQEKRGNHRAFVLYAPSCAKYIFLVLSGLSQGTHRFSS